VITEINSYLLRVKRVVGSVVATVVLSFLMKQLADTFKTLSTFMQDFEIG
jgi:hypothetical protein